MLPALSDLQPKHNVVIDTSVRDRGTRPPPPPLLPGFFLLLLSLALQSLPECCPFFLSFDILPFITVPVLISSLLSLLLLSSFLAVV